MKELNLEAKLKESFAMATPDILEAVLSDCEKQKGTVIFMTEQTKKPFWMKKAAGMAAALALLVTSVVGYQMYQRNYTVDSTVSLDVNPSIEIQVNQKEAVLAVTPLNEDGKIVLGDMQFSGSSLDITVNAIIGSMLRNGYISELSNSILVSVNSNDPSKSTKLQEKLAGEINTLLQTGSFQGAVLSQIVSADTKLQQLAEQYGITVGKAQLIQQLLSKNPLYTFESLAALSINELNLLGAAQSGILENVSSVGSASDKAYIGMDKAKSIALSHAGVTAASARFTQSKLDSDDGVLVYEIEFFSGSYEYDYDIHALTGEIWKSDKERDNDQSHPTTENTGNTGSTGTSATGTAGGISEAKAKEIALNHAGIAAASLTHYWLEREWDDGRLVYEIDFQADGYDYDYQVEISSGTIVQSEKEWDDDNYQPPTSTPASIGSSGSSTGTGGTTSTGNSSSTGSSNGGTLIGEARAKEIALNHAGLSASDISRYKIELDRDDGRPQYEIEFRFGPYEYDYEIDATTATILTSDKEMDD